MSENMKMEHGTRSGRLCLPQASHMAASAERFVLIHTAFGHADREGRLLCYEH